MPRNRPVVLVHGQGAAGIAAWPLANMKRWKRDFFALSRPGFGDDETPVRTDMAAEVAQILDAATKASDAAHVVAHSYGAIAATRAAMERPEEVRSLVLIEPTLFSLARGQDAVEAHIAAVGPVFAASEEVDAGEYARRFLTALGVEDAQAPTTESGLRVAEQWRLTTAPWEYSVDESVFTRVPTLVMTGQSQPEVLQTAEVIASHGAQHVSLKGQQGSPHLSMPGLQAIGQFLRAHE